jgi:hypothetical protein
VSLGIRLSLFFTSDAIIWPDSSGYISLAESIRNGDLSSNSGVRTPGYPLFLLFINNDRQYAVLAQIFLGLCVTTSLFWTTFFFTQNNSIATIAGASYGLNIAQIQFELSILTETLTTFLAILSVVFLFLLWQRVQYQKKYTWLVVLIGFTSSLTTITRPSFLFFPIVLSFFIAIILIRSNNKPWVSLLVLAITAFLIGGWSTINYIQHGFFGPSNITGYSLVELTGAVIEFVPEPYHQIRDIFLVYRPEQIRRYGVPIGTQWVSVEDVMAETGLSFTQLSNVYRDLSLFLIRNYPAQYARVGFISWNNYWAPADLHYWSNIRPGADEIYFQINTFWLTTKKLTTTTHKFFQYLVLGTLIFPLFHRRKLIAGKNILLVTLGAVVLSSALIHSVVSFGVPRYFLTTQTLATCVALSAAGILVKHLKSSHKHLLRIIKANTSRMPFFSGSKTANTQYTHSDIHMSQYHNKGQPDGTTHEYR